MKIENRLKNWVEAKLIEQQQADNILRYEQQQPSASWVIFGLCGLGIIVALTGVISIIAANWDDFSANGKLIAYFLSLIFFAALTVRYRDSNPFVRESLLSAFALYVLAGIGLIGQTYNLESDGYSALFFWLAIILPITLSTKSRLLNNIWFVSFITAILIWNFQTSILSRWENDRFFFTLALPYFFLTLGYALDGRISEYFCKAARLWSYVVLLIPLAFFGNFLWFDGSSPFKDNLENDLTLLPLITAITAILTALSKKNKYGSLLSYAISFTIISSFVLSILPLMIPIGKHDILGCLFFILAWSGAATMAAAFQHKRLFDFCALVIGIRFIVVYFEVFGSLAATGIGLIISGAVILSIAYFWYKYRGKFALAIQEAA